MFFGGGWTDSVAEVLLLGHDLALCDGWHEEPELVAQLRQRNKWGAARFEIGIWAGLRREGCQVTHEPREKAGGKIADFLVEDGGHRIAIEAKSIGSSDYERNCDCIESAVADGTPIWKERGHRVVLTLGEGLLRDTADLSFDDFDARYYCALRNNLRRLYEVLDGTWSFGEVHDVELLGKITFAPLPPRSPESLSWMLDDFTQLRKTSDDYTVQRALRRIRKSAAGQLASVDADLHVAVARVGRTTAPIEIATDWLGPIIKKAPEKYRSLDYIVLLDSHGRQATGWKTEAATYPLPWARMQVAGMNWPKGLTNWRLAR